MEYYIKAPCNFSLFILRISEIIVLSYYNTKLAFALTEYFKSYYRSKDDPYFETREREERFVEQIVSAVETAVEKALPTFLAACFTKMVMPYNTASPTINITNTNENNVSADDIDFDFVGG